MGVWEHWRAIHGIPGCIREILGGEPRMKIGWEDVQTHTFFSSWCPLASILIISGWLPPPFRMVVLVKLSPKLLMSPKHLSLSLEISLSLKRKSSPSSMCLTDDTFPPLIISLSPHFSTWGWGRYFYGPMNSSSHLSHFLQGQISESSCFCIWRLNLFWLPPLGLCTKRHHSPLSKKSFYSGASSLSFLHVCGLHPFVSQVFLDSPSFAIPVILCQMPAVTLQCQKLRSCPAFFILTLTFMLKAVTFLLCLELSPSFTSVTQHSDSSPPLLLAPFFLLYCLLWVPYLYMQTTTERRVGKEMADTCSRKDRRTSKCPLS